MIAGIPRKKILTYLGTLIVALLIVLIIRLTYAFLGDYYESNSKNVTIGGNTVDVLDFIESETPLKLNATPENIPKDGENYSVTANPKVSLTANDLTNTATYNYNFRLLIRNNSFVYTVGEDQPEIVLTIVDPDGNEIQDLPNLKYGTFNGVSGYDITTCKDSSKLNGTKEIVISSEYQITNDDPKNATIQDWYITLTFINLTSDQALNKNKSLAVDMLFSRGPYNENGDETLVVDKVYSMYSNGQMVKKITHTKNGESFDEYRYSGPYFDVNNFICFGPGSELYNTGGHSFCPDGNLYRIIGIIPDEDGNYRAKVIKNDYVTAYELENDSQGSITPSEHYNGYQSIMQGFHWSYEDYNNNWNESILKNELNNKSNSFLHYLGDWSSKIDYTLWHVQGIKLNESYDETYSYTVNDYYEREVGNLIDSEEEKNYPSTTAKIGLMYISDYGYAGASDIWNYPLSIYEEGGVAENANWLFNGVSEWTISRIGLNSENVYTLSGDRGSISYEVLRDRNGLGLSAVRPVFNLKSDVIIIEDTYSDGSLTYPFKIKV